MKTWRIVIRGSGMSCLVHAEGRDEKAARRDAIRKLIRDERIPAESFEVRTIERVPA
ncbi:MAG TPA: hypothetical protein PKJ38_13610 [Planctomycetota bacterium]|nr:hypothetical protein [Planctomycetota bacterium]